MPTRRVSAGSAFLPLSGASSHGALLIGAVVHEFVTSLDDDNREDLRAFLADAVDGIEIPRIVMRHRLQADTHGLDLSRHRVEQRGDVLIVELDTHGAALPQLLGLILAISNLPPSSRHSGLSVARRALEGRSPFGRQGVLVRRMKDGIAHEVPWAQRADWVQGASLEEAVWAGIDSERRWAMEVLGIPASSAVRRDDINRRYRRLLRDAHPDTGAVRVGAAERIEELGVARELLLDLLNNPGTDASPPSSARQ